MAETSRKNNIKVCVAHYRREQPLFKKIKELVDSGAIGKIKYVNLKFLKPSLAPDELNIPKTKWRVDPAIAGGGLFHDLAPHQLDLMLYFFGDIKSSYGHSFNQDKNYPADDVVTGSILFENGIVFSGLWCFTVQENEATDIVEIHGSKGKIQFGVFDNYNLSLTMQGKNEVISFERIQHVQQPMIEKVVQYFLGNGKNPCTPEDGVAVMEIMETFTKRLH